jgi:hypothetical protein
MWILILNFDITIYEFNELLILILLIGLKVFKRFLIYFILEKNLQVLCITIYFNKFPSNSFFRNFLLIKIFVRNWRKL